MIARGMVAPTYARPHTDYKIAGCPFTYTRLLLEVIRFQLCSGRCAVAQSSASTCFEAGISAAAAGVRDCTSSGFACMWAATDESSPFLRLTLAGSGVSEATLIKIW